MTALDRHGHKAVVLVSADRTLSGLVTDGDVRRALLAGAALDEPAPPARDPDADVVRGRRARAPRARPDAGAAHRRARGRRPRAVVGLHTLSDVVGARALPTPRRDHGGRGTRLGDLTQNTPKPLMRSPAGRSSSGSCSAWSAAASATSTSASTTSPTRSRSTSATARRLGCTVQLPARGPRPPARHRRLAGRCCASARPHRAPVVVMNGDLMVGFDAERPARLPRAQRRGGHRGDPAVPARGAVRRRRARAGRHVVTRIAEKPTLALDVNAGVYAVAPEALDLVPSGRPEHHAGPGRAVPRHGPRRRRLGAVVGLDRRRHPARPRPGEGTGVTRDQPTLGRRPSW